MKVVVTGASGNVGSAVLRALDGDSAVGEVLAVARRPAALGGPKVRWQTADISESALAPLLRSADAVIHLAWKLQPQHRPAELVDTNLFGTRRVLDAALDASVPALIVASSVGTYASGTKDRQVDESWPSTGIPSSTYSRHKAAVERMLDDVEARRQVRVVRMRTSLVFQRAAASEIARIFFGPFTPRRVPRALRLIPQVADLRVQATHAEDIAEAYRLALHSEDGGAFNIAAPGLLDAAVVAGEVEGRCVRVPAALARAAMQASFAARLQRSEPGWLDLARCTPLMDSTKARQLLGWSPRYNAIDAFNELLAGLGERAGTRSAPLHPARGGRMLDLEAG